MGRPRGIWWRKGSACYYTTIDGVKVRLEKTLEESRLKLARILAGQQPVADRSTTFKEVAAHFLTHSRETNEPETAEVHRLFLESFQKQVGLRPIARLVEADLDAWLRKNATWGENTQVRARAVILACLNYGVRKLGMPPHPLSHVTAGSCSRRDRFLCPQELEKVRGAVSGVFGEFVRALELTGARPFSEVAKVTAADVDLLKGTWTLAKWKNRRKKKIKRVIFLVPEMVEMSRRLIEQHPSGALFRNRLGAPWTRQALTARFRALGERLGIDGLMAYTFRHCWITDALARGVPAAVVAELCGTSIQTIERHYRHLDARQDVLREAMKKATGATD